MDCCVTGAVIRTLRERLGMTQAELAEKICVSDKTVSKWETGRGFPGQAVMNTNRSSNMMKSRFYVCPVCGNVLFARGDAVVSCCGIQLPVLEGEDPDPAHMLEVQKSEDEILVTAKHSMSKDHFLSFVAYMTTDRCEIRALYPEGSADTRFFYRGSGWLFCWCNRHGLFRQRLDRKMI